MRSRCYLWGLMPKGMVRGLHGIHMRLFSSPLILTLSDMPGKKRSEEDLNHMTSDTLWEESSAWGRGPTLQLSIARHPGLTNACALLPRQRVCDCVYVTLPKGPDISQTGQPSSPCRNQSIALLSVCLLSHHPTIFLRGWPEW